MKDLDGTPYGSGEEAVRQVTTNQDIEILLASLFERNHPCRIDLKAVVETLQ
ncbi:MAG TPA: hypothetical protein PLF11_04770 [Bacillota bacterium]|nr:hypothetical protein [Bacillota bacterium]